jgi:hypothetical protein
MRFKPHPPLSDCKSLSALGMFRSRTECFRRRLTGAEGADAPDPQTSTKFD